MSTVWTWWLHPVLLSTVGVCVCVDRWDCVCVNVFLVQVHFANWSCTVCGEHTAICFLPTPIALMGWIDFVFFLLFHINRWCGIYCVVFYNVLYRIMWVFEGSFLWSPAVIKCSYVRKLILMLCVLIWGYKSQSWQKQ